MERQSYYHEPPLETINNDENDHRHERAAEIDVLVAQRTAFRRREDWLSADAIQQKLLLEPYQVRIIDNKTQPSIWVPIKQQDPPKVVSWSALQRGCPFTKKQYNNDDGDGSRRNYHLPLMICTVKTAHYRSRYQETISHLENRHCCCSDNSGKTFSFSSSSSSSSCCTGSFQPKPCYMLDLTQHPSLGTKKVLFESWRTILLPTLLTRQEEDISKHVIKNKDQCSFVLIAEDDVRLPTHVCPKYIYNVCSAALDAHPTLDILSLGHAWKGIVKDQQQQPALLEEQEQDDSHGENQTTNSLLHRHLANGGRVNGTTLLALRFPDGARRLIHALETCKKTHLDQFLFHSTNHDLSIALSDPPLVGWAEVDVTLTSVASGYRRKGGGRRAFLPPRAQNGGEGVHWVTRRILTESS